MKLSIGKSMSYSNIYMQQPLFVKFRAEQSFYLFDSCTNEILRVSQEVYAIIDDFQVINDDVIIKKHSGVYGERRIQNALEALRRISKGRFLQTNYRKKTLNVKGLCLQQKRYTFDEFLSTFSAMLIVELTQNCNLDCSYCIYGKHYHRHLPRGAGSISEEIAERAIKSHLEKEHSGRTITFYGGEPLLEFNLMRRLISYAEQYCRNTKKEKPTFSLTTNGTLLNDEILHFLVEHDCNVMISVDGDRETHDRYRLYKGNGRGSFDTIEANLKRFAELYPQYQKRGIMLTMTASTDYYQTNEFLKKQIETYPSIVVNLADSFLGINKCVSFDSCAENNCAKSSSFPDENISPDFLRWTSDAEKQWHRCLNEFQSAALYSGIAVKKEWPLFFNGFHLRMRRLFERKIKPPQSGRVAYCCIPGAVRLYCDIHGNYYPCERVELRDSLKIGDVDSGINAFKVANMINDMSDVTACGSCVGKHLCRLCPAMTAEDRTNCYSDIRIKQHCNKFPLDLENQRNQFISLMKAQPDFFSNFTNDDPLQKNFDWVSNVHYLYDTQS